MVGGDCIRVHKQLKKKAGVRVFRCSRTDRLITNYVPLGIVVNNIDTFIATKPEKLPVCDHFDG